MKYSAESLREGFVTANGLNFHYYATGPQNGPLVLFAHGFPDLAVGWAHQMRELAAQGFLCVAPDQRGYNLSDKPDALSAYYPKHMVTDLREIAASFGGEGTPFTLVAHDWGGAIAWAFALKYPDLLEKLIIINATHPGAFQKCLANNPDQVEKSQYINLYRTDDAEDVVSANNYAGLLQMFGESFENGTLTEADKAALITAWSKPGALTAMLNWYRTMRIEPPDAQKGGGQTEGTFDDEALKVHVPTRVIWGMGDQAFASDLIDYFPPYVPDLEITRVEDGTHWVVHEYPELVAAALKRWLAE
ncbi:MAG: alpha/beta fold hydrolase [Alphaproteobacteria bacterium]